MYNFENDLSYEQEKKEAEEFEKTQEFDIDTVVAFMSGDVTLLKDWEDLYKFEEFMHNDRNFDDILNQQDITEIRDFLVSNKEELSYLTKDLLETWPPYQDYLSGSISRDDFISACKTSYFDGHATYESPSLATETKDREYNYDSYPDR